MGIRGIPRAHPFDGGGKKIVAVKMSVLSAKKQKISRAMKWFMS